MNASRRSPGRQETTTRPRGRLASSYASAAVRTVLERHGRFAHHGDPCRVAAEWLAAGFDAGEVDAWLSRRCTSPKVAAQLAARGCAPDRSD